MDFQPEHIDAWNGYQGKIHNDVASRIELFGLLRFAGKNKTMIDLGANMGLFGTQLSEHFQSITSLEPVVNKPVDLSEKYYMGITGA